MNIKYLIAFLSVLLIEISIAFSDGFTRHTLGDYFVVILLYCFLKIFINYSYKKVAFSVLFFAYTIEFIQLTALQNLCPPKYVEIFKLTLGSTFSYIDLIAYTLGIATVLVFEYKFKKAVKT